MTLTIHLPDANSQPQHPGEPIPPQAGVINATGSTDALAECTPTGYTKSNFEIACDAFHATQPPWLPETLTPTKPNTHTSGATNQEKMGGINNLSEEQCLQYFKARLGKLNKQSSHEYLAHCAFHPDNHPSLSINPVKRSWYCLSACQIGGGMIDFEMKYAAEIEQIPCDKSKAKKRISEVLGTQKVQSQEEDGEEITSCTGEPEAIYPYTDAFGTVLFQMLRYPGKKFFQRRPDGKGGWIYKTSDIKKVLYHLPDVASAKHVVVCEGEKDADNLKAALGETDLTGEICTKWNERESTWRKSGSCQSRGTSQSR